MAVRYMTLFFRVGSKPPARRSGVKTVPTSGTRLVGSLILEEAPPLSIVFGMLPEAGTSVWEVVTFCRQSSAAAAGHLLVASPGPVLVVGAHTGPSCPVELSGRLILLQRQHLYVGMVPVDPPSNFGSEGRGIFLKPGKE